jgi:hypothetical protein
MNLTELLDRAQTRMLDNAFEEEESIAATLPANRFCGKGCRYGFASDIRLGLVAGLGDPNGCCAYCDDDLDEQPQESSP